MKTLKLIDWPLLAFWGIYGGLMAWLVGKILVSPLPGWLMEGLK